MAETHTLLCTAQPLKDAEIYLGLWNEDATQKLRIRRVGFINAQISGVSPAQEFLIHLYRRTGTTAWTPSSVLTPLSHDTGNSGLSNAVTGFGSDVNFAGGSQSELRIIMWDGNDPSGNGVLWSDWESIVPFGIVWDVGYGQSGTIEPLKLNEDDSFYVEGDGGGASATNFDVWCEFTNET